MWWFGGVWGFVFTEVRGDFSFKRGEFGAEKECGDLEGCGALFSRRGTEIFHLNEGNLGLKRNVVIWRGVGLCFHGGARRSFTEGHVDFLLRRGMGG